MRLARENQTMSATKPDPLNQIPESLRKQLEEFRRQLWRRKVIEAAAAGLIGLLFSFLLIFGLDRIWQTLGWVRLLILLGGVSLFAGFAPYWLHRWIWGHRREGQLARLISKRFPGLGDRLLGVIELQGQTETVDTLSPRLRSAAMEAVAAETGKRDLGTALPAPRHRKWALAAIALMCLTTAAFIATPKAGLNALERWILPFSKVERYTFTQLQNPPTELAVPYGEAFEVKLQLSAASEQKPGVASARLGLQPEQNAKLDAGEYRFRFPGQQENGSVAFRIGDLRHIVQILPMQRPSVERTRVLVKSPDYLGVAEKNIDLSVGELSAVEGSVLVFEMDTSRPLNSGSYGPAAVYGDPADAPAASDSFEALAGDLEISGHTIKTQPLTIGAIPFELPFAWQDEFGLTGGNDFKLRVDALKDAPPVAYTQGMEKQKAMLPEETLDFEILCEDDFGLKTTGIEWESLSSFSGEATTEKGELLIGKGGPEQRRILEPVAFSPAAFGITPQKIMVRAFSEDFYPQRGRIYSEPVMIYVLTREEHAQLLKSQFDRVISELEDVSRKELNLLDENQRLERLDGEELQTEENRKRIDAQEQAESENTSRMEDLGQKMEELMKNAARNGDIDKETLKKMAQALKPMQELAEKDMPAVRDQLREAQEQSNTEEKTKQDIEQAVAEQKEVVEKMKKALEQANDANKRFEASTFVSRLKKAATEQEGIATSLIASFSNVGEYYEKIDPSDQRRLQETIQLQMLIASDIRWIQEDLGHYYARTSNEPFKEILDEMRASNIDQGLEVVREKLQKNHSSTGTEAAKLWANQLSDWAKKLNGELEEKNSGNGGDGGGSSPEDEDFEFMLRVMKMIQTEQDLRARTRVLEQLKRDAAGSAQLSR